MIARLRSCLYVFALAAALLVGGPRSAPATPGLQLTHAYVPSVLNGEGLDSCNYYSASTWNAALSKPYYYAAGIYMGGATASVANCTTHAASFFQNLSSYLYLMPIWDDLQCGTAYSHQMSNNLTAAKNQGVAAADTAISAMQIAQLNGPQMIYLDLESGGSGCEDRMRHYADGWDKELHAQGYLAGVYGSACSPDMSIYAAAAHVPDDVWMAEPGGDNTVAGINSACVPTSDWVNHQRIHQYTQGQNFTYGGVTVYVDHDCLNATVDGPGDLNSVCDG